MENFKIDPGTYFPTADNHLISPIIQDYENSGRFIQSQEDFAKSISMPGDSITELISKMEQYNRMTESILANGPQAVSYGPGTQVDLNKSINSLAQALNPDKPTLRASARPEVLGTAEDYARYANSGDFQAFGYNPSLGFEQEYRYGRAMTWMDTLGKAFAGAGALAADTFIEGWKGWGRMAEALFTWDASKLYGSPEERMEIAKQQEAIFNKYAIYNTAESEDSLLNRQFFGNMLQQTGFTIGAIGQMALETWATGGIAKAIGLAVGGLGKANALRTAVNVGELVNDTRKVQQVISNSQRVTNTINNIARNVVPLFGTTEDLIKAGKAGAGTLQLGMLGVGGVKRELSLFNMARSEAIFEAASTYKDLEGRLVADFVQNNGRQPNESELNVIRNTADNASSDNFYVNTGILTLMNRIQFGNMFKSFNNTRKIFNEGLSTFGDDVIEVTGQVGGKTQRKVYEKGFFGSLGATRDIAATFGKKKAAWEATKSVGRGLMKFEGSEGAQELLQEASNKGLSDYYYDLYNGKKGYGSKIDAVLSSIQNPITDLEGTKTFLMGALTGRFIAPFSYGVKHLAFTKDAKAIQAQKAEAIKVINTFYSDPTQYVKEQIANVKVQNRAAETMEEAAKNQDRYTFHNAKDSAFAKAISSAIKLNMYESLKDSMLEFGQQMTEEEFKKAFSIDPSSTNRKSVNDFIGKVVSQMDEYYTVYQNLKDKYGDRIIPELYKNNSPEEYEQVKLAKIAQDQAIEMLATNVFRSRQATKRAVELTSEMAANANIGSSATEMITKLGSEQAINSTIEALQKEVKMMEAAETLTPEQRELLNQKKEELQLAETWKTNYESIMAADDENYTPATQERAYKAFQDIINHYNKVAKKDTVVTREDIDDNFLRMVDYLLLNRDSKNFIDAMNLLADPYNMTLIRQTIKNSIEEMGKRMQEEHRKEVEDIDKEEEAPAAPAPEGKVSEELGIQEGKEYLTEAVAEPRVYKGKRTTAYKQDVIKIISIGDDTVTFSVNNDGETITFGFDEFRENVGKLFPMDRLTTEQRIYFRNRNIVFDLNVRGKSGKRHLIKGAHADRDYSSTGVVVKARLQLALENRIAEEPVMVYDEATGQYVVENQEGTPEYVLRVVYKNPVTGEQDSFEYDADYLKKYAANKVNLFDITESEEAFLGRANEKRRLAQIDILNAALDEVIARWDGVAEQKRANEEKYNALKAELDGYLAEMSDIQREIALLPPRKKGPKTKERKRLEAAQASLTELIGRTKDLITNYENEIAALEKELETIEKVYDAYQLGITELKSTGVPYTLDERGSIVPPDATAEVVELEQNQLIKPKRNISNEKLDQMILDTEAEIDVLNERIAVLNDLLDRITRLSQFDKVPDLVDALENIEDKQQLLTQLTMIKRQETDPDKVAVIQGVINMLVKKADSLETAYLFDLADRFNQYKRDLADIQTQLGATEDKLLRLYTAKEQRGRIEKAQDRVNAYKQIQDELVRQYKIRRERAGVKQEGNKIIVSVGAEPLTDDLIAGPDAILTTQVIEDVAPGSELEKESYTIVEGRTPILSATALFKTAGRHFADLQDTTVNSPEDARFFKFSETAILRDKNGSVFFLMPVTKDSKEFQDLRVTSWQEDGKTINYDDDIRLVVVKRDGSGKFRPVDVNGNILDNPTKDNMVYTGMLGHPNLLSDDKAKVKSWLSANFINKTGLTEDEIDTIVERFKTFRNTVKERVKNNEPVFLPIEDKSPGVFNREPQGYNDAGQLQPQELSLKGRLIESDPDFKNLRHPDGSAIKLTVSTFNGKVRPGRLLMVKEEDPNSSVLVYNRKFTEEEHNNLIDVLKRMSDLFDLKAADLFTPELDDEFRLGIKYLQGVVHWFSPKEGFTPHTFQMWVRNGLHIGENTIEFTAEAIEANRVNILAALPYHKVNNAMLSDKKANDAFTEVKVIDGKIVGGTKYVNYQHYLLADREGGPIVYTNIKPYTAPKADGYAAQDFQLKNVYLRYGTDGILEEEAPFEEDITEAAPAAEVPTGGIKTYGLQQNMVKMPNGEVMYSIANNIPKGPKLTFVRKRADGVTNLYVHTEYSDGKYKVTQVIDENGNDFTSLDQNGKTLAEVNEEIINTVVENVDDNLVKNVQADNKALQDDILVPFNQTFVAVEDFASKGNKVVTPAKVATVTAPVAYVPAADPAFDKFVLERYQRYADDIVVSGEEPISLEEYADIFHKKLMTEYKATRKLAATTSTATTSDTQTRRNKAVASMQQTADGWRAIADDPGGASADEILGDTKEDVLKQIDKKYKNEISSAADDASEYLKLAQQAMEQEDDDVDPNARVNNPDAVSKENIEEFKTWMKANLPQFMVEVFDSLVDGRYMGQFYNGAVRLYENAEEGTGFHEAFEAVWNALLTPEQQQEMIREYKNRPNWNKQEQYQWAVANYPYLSEAGRIKEALAEEFREYMMSDAGNVKAESPKRNTWFRRLWKFLKELFGFGNKAELDNKIQSVFSRIASGGFKNQEILPTYDPSQKNNKAIKGTSVEFTQALMEGMTATFFDLLYSNNNNVQQLFDPKNNLFDEYFRKTYNKVFNTFNPGLKAILNNEKFQQETPERQLEEIRKYKAWMNDRDPLFQMKDAALKGFQTEVRDQFKKYLTQFGLSFTTTRANDTDAYASSPVGQISEELVDELLSKEDTSNAFGLRDVIYVDPTTLTNPSVRLLILSLTSDKQDVDGKVIEKEKNQLGLTSLVPYKRKMNILLNDLSNIVPVFRKQADGTMAPVSALDAMVEKLKDKYADPIHPARFKQGYEWVGKLLKRLKYDQLKQGQTLTDDELRLLLAFENAFNRNRNIPLKVIVGKDGRLRHVDAISVNTVQKIKEEWRNNVKDKAARTNLSDLANGDLLFVNPGGFIEVNLQSRRLDIALNASSFREKLEVLARLGMKFSVPSDKLSASDQADIESAFNAMRGVIKDRKAKNQNFYYSEFFDRKTVEGPLNVLLAIEANQRSEDTLLSHLTPEGKTQYAITLPSEISNVINSMAGVNTLEEFIASNPQYGSVAPDGTIVLNPYQRGSQILKPGGLFFDSKGNKIFDRATGEFKTLRYEYIQGMASDQTNEGDNTDRLTFNDKITQEIYHLMRGTYFSIINSDKSSEFGINMGHFIKPDEVNNMGVIEEKYLEALRDEVMHALTFHFSPNYIENHQNRVLMLGHFSGILGFEKDGKGSRLQLEFNRLVENAKVNKRMKRDDRELLYNTIANNFVGSVRNDGIIRDYVKAQIEEHKQWLLSREVVTKDEATGKFKTLSVPADNALMGEEVLDMNDLRFTQLATFLAINRQLAVFEQHKLFYGHPALYKDLPKRSNGANSQKNAVSENADVIRQMNQNKPRFDGRVRDAERPVVKSITYADVDVVSSRLNSIAEVLYRGFEPLVGKKRAEQMIGGEFNADGTLKKLNATKGSYLAAYAKMTEADGQSYIMPDYFRDLLFLSSGLSKDQEALLEYENALEIMDRKERNHPHYKQYSEAQIARAEEILKQPKPTAIIQPLKPQGFGFSMTPGMSHVNMLKNSVFPLTWSRVKNNPTMLAKYIDAQNKGVDVINFQSGHKVGAVTKPDGTFVSMYNPDGSINTEVPVEMDLISKYMGIQVETPAYAKDKVIFGSQVRKIILSNLPAELEPQREEYMEVIDQLLELERQDLLNELGLKEVDGVYESEDLTKMMTTMREQAIRRGMPDNVIDMLDTFVTDLGEQLKYPLDANPARERIEYVLQAMVDTRLIRMEMFGKASVQVASTMWEQGKRNLVYMKDGVYTAVQDYEALTPKEKKTVQITSSDLKFYDGNNPYMEVYLPWYFDGVKDPSKAGFKQVNGVWIPEDPKAMESVLSAIGFRIPTQGFNSIESIRIKGFLDPSYGDMVVVPSEMVGKSGSDFDIDKLNMFLSNYKIGRNGQLSYVNYSTSKEELPERYINYINAKADEDVRKMVYALSSDERKALRDKFKSELDRINAEADLNYNANKNALYDDYRQSLDNLRSVEEDTNNYFLELFEAGRKQYWRLTDDVRNTFNNVKAHIIQQKINGPREIQLYLEHAIMLRESGMYKDDDLVLSNMITIYQEELRVLGYSEEVVQKHYDAALETFRKKKAEVSQAIRANREVSVVNLMDSNDKEMQNIYLEMAKQMARVAGMPTIEQFEKLPLAQQNGKKSLQNRLIEIMKQVIEHPANRRQLLVPNSTARLKKIAEMIVGLRGASQVENDLTKLSEWKSMAETRETFVTSKQLVGAGALQITSHVMAQIGQVELSGTYKNNQGETKNVNIKLPNAKTLKMDLTVDSSEQFIFDIMSEALSGSVDAAKDPFIFELRLNLETASTWFYLTKRGVSQEDLALFFNQPAIDAFFKARDLNRTFVSEVNENYLYFNDVIIKAAKPFFEQATGTIIPEDEYPQNTLRRFRGLQENYGSYTTKEMVEMIGKKKLTQDEAGKQVAMLMDMLDYRDQANLLSNFIRGISYDTARTKSMVENRLQRLRYNKMLNDGFVTKASIERVFDRTFLGKLKTVKDDVENMFSEFFVSLQPKTLPVFDPLMKQLDNPDLFLTNDDRAELLNRYQSFVLGYILQNTPYGRNAALATKFDLFMDTKDSVSLPKMLKKMKDRYPNNLALKNLFPLINDNRNATDNIKLFNNKMSAYEINLMSESLETLTTLAQANGDTELQHVVENLATFTILQSGLQMSPVTFTKVMPLSLYADLAAKIFRSYMRSVEPADVDKIWRAFHQNYSKNKIIVPSLKRKRSSIEGGLLTLRRGDKMAGYDYLKVYVTREGVTTDMLQDDSIPFDQKYTTRLFEKIKIVEAGEDVTEQKPVIRYRPINILGNGMYALETIPGDPITGQSRFETINEQIDESIYQDAVNEHIQNMNEVEGDSDTPQFDKLPKKDPSVSSMTYAGIGSRETPAEVLKEMAQAVKELDKLGFTANTGDAKGADKTVRDNATKKNVFTPADATSFTREIAREIHPAPQALEKKGGLDLMARNTNQVFGKDLDTPVDFVLAYDSSGWEGQGPRPQKGGTLQAIDMAARKGIPVINMANPGWKERLNAVVKEATSRPVVRPVAPAPVAAEQKATLINYKSFAEAKAAHARGEGVWTMRPNKDVKLDANKHYGNPWSPAKQQLAPETIVVPDDGTAVKNYREWLQGTAHQDVQPARRQWIVDQINSGALKGKKLIYYKPGNYFSHADALLEMVNGGAKLTTKAVQGTLFETPHVNKGWARKSANGYEVSTKGDSRFSAFNARIKAENNRTIEEIYQTDVKGYSSIQEGKGKPARTGISRDEQYAQYKDLWRQWASENPKLMQELAQKTQGKVLTDMFANTDINQARALSEILNEYDYSVSQSFEDFKKNLERKNC